MNAYKALQDLRKTRDERHQLAALRDTVNEQSEQIRVLQEQKDRLEDRLNNLSSGQKVEELIPWDDPELKERIRFLRELKEKLAAFRLIGPCGLTASDVNPSSLVVTFTPMWQSLSEIFYVNLVANDDGVQVSATNIPYFFNLSELVGNMKADITEVLNVIGLKLKSYIQRKAELQLVLTSHADVITGSSYTEPATFVDIQLQSLDTPTEIMKYIDVNITYSNVDDVLPSKVKFSPKNIPIPKDAEEELSQLMLNSPLTTAMTRVVEYLTATRAHIEPLSEEEEPVDD